MSLQDFYKRIRETSLSPRAKQLLLLGGFSCCLIGLATALYLSSSLPDEKSPGAVKPSEPKPISQMATPLQAVDARDIWVSRIEKKAEEVREESETLRQENQFLQKRLDVLESLFGGRSTLAPPDRERESHSPLAGADPVPEPVAEVKSASPFPSPGDSESPSPQVPLKETFPLSPKKKGPRIAHIRGRASGISLRTKDQYMPAGTYSKAVVVSGMAASTATSAQGNPQPMMLRLVDDGNLPRGFKGGVKDAVIVGSCYGDISSERAYCRLETMSWVEPDGTIVEKKVEGWVFGEDGRAGLRGEVVDRSSEIARESFGAGLLSAVANFFKMESSRGIYPVSPFGQTNAMNSKEMMQGAASSGAGSALDRLAEFSIKRAEQMQPVILIASGRVVDIAFKEGVSLLADEGQEMKLVGSPSQDHSKQEGED